MSRESALLFLEHADQDPALRRQLAEARLESVRRVAAAYGFTFSEDELQAALMERSGELSDEALQGVAGGLYRPPVEQSLSPLDFERSMGE
jgi:predicted ribosomally synthesized peptide with nif11-like leader